MGSHWESLNSAANVISARTLSPTKEWVELRIFTHFPSIMGAELKVLNIQITVQIRLGSTRMGEER